MAAGVLLTWEAIVGAITVLHTTRVIGSRSFTSTTLGHGYWQVPVIAISASIMVLLIAAGEALLHLVGVKPTPTPPPIRAFLSPDEYRSAPPR